MFARPTGRRCSWKNSPRLYTSRMSSIKSKATSAAEVAAKPVAHGRTSGTLLRMLKWAKTRSGHLPWLYACIPFRWRLSLRRWVHATTGAPIPPIPLSAERRAKRADWAVSPPVTPGINVLGYARGQFGVAECLRGYARALERANYPFGIFNLDVGAASGQQDSSMDRHFSDALRFAVNAFFLNADQMPIARSVLGRQAFAGRHNIGYWLWELETFPRDWRGSFRLVDEVWAPTAFVRDTISAATDKPVLRIPMVVEPQAAPGMDRAYFGLPHDAFVFLFSYDFNGFASRKNPEAAIAAFRLAFGGGDAGVRLLLKSSNGSRFRDRLAAIQQSIADDTRIELRDGFLSREEISALQSAADCFVSLHRSEGFGLGLAECMYFGKPVIATGYSGNLDFMRPDNSLLVDYKLVPMHNGDYPYWRGQQWAEPDVAHAATLMRQVRNDRDFARRIGAAAAASIRRTNSSAVVATEVTARLHDIEGKLSSADRLGYSRPNAT